MTVWILIGLHVTAALAGVCHVLRYYRRPASAVAWIFALVFLPVLGPLAYVALALYPGPSSLRRRRRTAQLLRSERATAGDHHEGYRDSIDRAGFPHMMNTVCSFPITAGNRVELIEDDGEALERQLEAIRSARKEVLLQTYVLKPGGVQERLFEALVESSRAGAEVCVLVDPIGSHELPSRLLRAISGTRLRVATFLRPSPFKGRFQIDFRNHRKLLCVDGTTAFTGGRNWSDEYYGAFSGAAFRDTTFEVRGPVTTAMRRVFLEDWAAATDGELAEGEPEEAAEASGETYARLLPSGPDEPTDGIVQVLAGAFRAARDSIVIVTPYFVPGVPLLHVLMTALRSGVSVTLLIPRSSDDRLVDVAARYYVAKLLEAGGDVHFREGRLLHSKAVIVDGVWSTVGSTNVDCRSFEINYELNLEVTGSELATRLARYFEADFAAATPADRESFATRGAARRIAENAAALLSPVL